jgi:hypothetical protein
MYIHARKHARNRAYGESVMSTRYNNGPQYQNQQRVAELHDNAAHAHSVAAERPDEQDHKTGHEASRQAQEHAEKVPLTPEEHPKVTTEHGFIPFGHEEIATLAYQLWQARGCPEGSPEEDWSKAVAHLRLQK